MLQLEAESNVGSGVFKWDLCDRVAGEGCPPARHPADFFWGLQGLQEESLHPWTDQLGAYTSSWQ